MNDYLRDKILQMALERTGRRKLTREEIITSFIGAAAVMIATYHPDNRAQVIGMFQQALADHAAQRARELSRSLGH